MAPMSPPHPRFQCWASWRGLWGIGSRVRKKRSSLSRAFFAPTRFNIEIGGCGGIKYSEGNICGERFFRPGRTPKTSTKYNFWSGYVLSLSSAVLLLQHHNATKMHCTWKLCPSYPFQSRPVTSTPAPSGPPSPPRPVQPGPPSPVQSVHSTSLQSVQSSPAPSPVQSVPSGPSSPVRSVRYSPVQSNPVQSSPSRPVRSSLSGPVRPNPVRPRQVRSVQPRPI